MRRTRVLWLCVLFSMCSVALSRADSIPDPDIQVNDPICDSSSPCAPLVGGPNGNTPFSFSSLGTGGGSFSFEVDPANTKGFFTLDIEVAHPFTVTNCLSDKFVCSSTILAGNVTDMFFTEKTSCNVDGCFQSGGFGPSDVFTITLDDLVCVEGSCTDPNPGFGGWLFNGAPVDFRVQADLSAAPTDPLINAPEPSSLFLLCTGASVFALRRRVLRK